MKNRYSFRYFFSEGIANIFLNGFMSFAAISIIVVCLIIVGSVGVILLNLEYQISELQNQSEITAFVEEGTSDAAGKSVRNAITKLENIASYKFVTGEEAFLEYKKSLGDQGHILDGLEDENILRDEYRIRVKDINGIKDTINKVSAIDGIANVSSSQETTDALIKVKKVFEIISVTLLTVLGAVSVFIISNTIKLALFERREEIAIMKMVGGTNWFIRWPFIFEGFILGTVSGFIAFFIQWFMYNEIYKFISDSLGALSIVHFSVFFNSILSLFMVAGILIGVCGSAITIGKFMDV